MILKLVDRKDKPSQKVSQEQMLQMKITGGGGKGNRKCLFFPVLMMVGTGCHGDKVSPGSGLQGFVV